LSTFLISVYYLLKNSLENFIFLCKKSINDVISYDKIDTKINKDNINLPKKDKDEKFNE
jgi:hypothetical protein